ncbi:hypothetical protein MNBD_GAMMA01-1326 [hydrothermal vent metagenome]|uniref:Uncharacterized protein n=1 Tax=hydrothermal vent metagenome TaxID=652676 RepID=A0A3B0VKP7_9ZZZZ
MIEVEIGNTGQFVDFPDGTPPEVMQKALTQYRSKQEPLPEGGIMETITEPLKAISAGAGGQIASGLIGAASLPLVGADKAAESIREIQESASKFGTPKTKAGKKSLETIGDLIQSGIDVVNFPISGLAGLAELITGQGLEQATESVKSVQDKGVSETLSERAFEETDSPLMAAVGAVLPEAVMSLIPLGRMKVKRTAFKEKIAEKILQGETTSDLAKYMLKGSGRVVKDKVAKEAIAQGFDEGVVSAIKGASKTDRVKMSSMTNIAKRVKEDTLFGMKNRPSDVAGKTLLERVNHVKRVNTSSGRRLDAVAKTLKGQDADFSTAIDNFTKSLDDMGITLDRNLRPKFLGSDIEGLAGPQNVIKNIMKRMSSGKQGAVPSAYDMHRMKRFIDEQVTYGKSLEGLGGKTETILKKLRRDLDTSLDETFPAYNRVNTEYSDTIRALDALQDVAGKKMDLFGKNADKATGTLLRRLMGNAQSRVNLIDAADELEGVARKYGLRVKDDVSVQMLFADELENVFGPSTRTSFKAEIGKGLEFGARAVRGSKIDAALSVAGKGIKKLRGISEENAFKSMTELLKR